MLFRIIAPPYAEFVVLRQLHYTHIAATKHFQDAVMRDGLANHGECANRPAA
jgi:hypothetical protein